MSPTLFCSTMFLTLDSDNDGGDDDENDDDE